MTTYVLTTGTDDIEAGATGGNTIVAGPDTLNFGDTIEAGTGGGNVLLLNGAGDFDLTAPDVLTDLGTIVAGDAGEVVTLRAGLRELVTLAAAGNDTIYLATAGDTVLSNGGSNDTVYAPAALINSVTADGGSFGILYVEGAVNQSVSLGPDLTNFAYVHIDQNGNTLDTGNLPNALVYIDNTFSPNAAADTVILRGNGESVTDYTGGNVINFAGGAGTLDLPYAGPGPEGTETLENFISLDSVILDSFPAEAIVRLDAATDLLTVSDIEGDSQTFQLLGSYDPNAFSLSDASGTETLTYTGTVSGTTYVLTTGADDVEAGSTGGNSVIAGPDTLNNGDTIDAGTGGGNILYLTGAGVFDLSQPDTLTGIGAVISQTAGQTIDLRPGLPVALTLSNQGSETVTLANAGDSVAGGTGGHNTIYLPLAIAGGTAVDAGSGGNNTLTFTGVGQSAKLGGNINSPDIATAHIAQSGDTLDLNGTTFQTLDVDPGTGAGDDITLGFAQVVEDATGGNSFALKANDNLVLATAGANGAAPQSPDTVAGFGTSTYITLQQFTTNQAVSYDANTDTLTVTGGNATGQSVSQTIQLAGDYYLGTFSISHQAGQPGVVTFSGTVSTTPPATTPVTPVYWDGQYGTLVGSNGTQFGTSAIEPYTSTIQSSGFQAQAVVNGKLYATSTGGNAALPDLLYASDGTTAGTMPLVDFGADGTGAEVNPNESVIAGSIGAAGSGAAFLTAATTGRAFANGQTADTTRVVTLWSTNGTTAGTYALASYTSESLFSGYQGVYGGSGGGLYYYAAATGPSTDWAVYATNGATVTKLQDTGTAEPTSFYADTTGGLYYVVNGALDHSDGTAAGTKTVIAPPANNGDVEENALFGAYNGDAILAYSDYGVGNTAYLGLADPSGGITQLGTIGYFGNVIYDSEVQVDPTHLVFDNQGTLFGSTGAGALTAIGTTGLPGGASVFAQFGTGLDVVANGTLYFFGQVTNGSSTYEGLFSTDGVTAKLVDDFGQVAISSNDVGQLTADGSTVFMTVFDLNNGTELRRTDGSTPTQLVGPTNGLFFDPANIVAGPLTPDSPTPSPQTYTLTTGTDTVTGGASDNTIVATNDTLNSGDQIDGGAGGRNVLLLQGGGTFDLGAPTTLTDIAEIDAQPGGVSGATQTITLRDGLNAIVRVTPGHDPETITGANNSDQIIGTGDQNFGAGYDTTVIVGAATETIDVTNALVQSTAANAGALIVGPSTITLTTGGTATLNPDDQIAGATITLTKATDLGVGGSGNLVFGSVTTIDLTEGGNTLSLGDNGEYSINPSVGGDTVVEQPDASYNLFGASTVLNGDTVDGFGVNGTITDYVGLPTHGIDFTDINPNSFSFSYKGSQLTVGDGTHTATLTVPIANFNAAYLHHAADGAGTVVSYEITCFLAGTRLATPEGDRAVESLRAGDAVTTLSGDARPVRWIGRRRIDPSAHPYPDSVRPVRVRAGALGLGVPCRDLLISPDHALLLDGVLVPARLLVNGESITVEPTSDPFTYWHIELDAHDILLAEGAPAETYLDTGNRALFESVGGEGRSDPVTSRTQSCAPYATEEAEVAPIWGRLARQRPARPASRRDEPAALMVGGRRLAPVFTEGNRLVFALPPGADEIRLVSAAARPSDAKPWLDDRRRLGLPVARIEVDGTVQPLDGPAQGEGWWDLEHGAGRSWRWTNGDAALRLPSGAALLTVTLMTEPDRIALAA